MELCILFILCTLVTNRSIGKSTWRDKQIKVNRWYLFIFLPSIFFLNPGFSGKIIFSVQFSQALSQVYHRPYFLSISNNVHLASRASPASFLFTFRRFTRCLGYGVAAVRNNRETTVFKSSGVPKPEAYRLPPRDTIDFSLRRDEERKRENGTQRFLCAKTSRSIVPLSLARRNIFVVVCRASLYKMIQSLI